MLRVFYFVLTQKDTKITVRRFFMLYKVVTIFEKSSVATIKMKAIKLYFLWCCFFLSDKAILMQSWRLVPSSLAVWSNFDSLEINTKLGSTQGKEAKKRKRGRMLPPGRGGGGREGKLRKHASYH